MKSLLVLVGVLASFACGQEFDPVFPGSSAPLPLVRSMEFGDFDGNATPDLVITFDPGAPVVVATVLDFGLNPSRLSTPVAIPTAPPGGRLRVLGVADFTGDSLDDILLVRSGAFLQTQLFLLPGTGMGNFGASMTLTTPAGLANPVAVDLTGDGILDLIGSTCAGGSCGFIVYQGSGTAWTPVYTEQGYNFGPAVSGSIGDFNGDGIDDIGLGLTSPSAPTGELRILWGNASASFTTSVSQFALSNQAAFSSAADTDQDGFADLVFNVTGQGPTVLLSRGSVNGLLPPTPIPTSGLPSTHSVIPLFVDFDADGITDILEVDFAPNPAPWAARGYRGDGIGGGFTGPQSFFPIQYNSFFGLTPKTIDADNDGDEDLLLFGLQGTFYYRNAALYGDPCPGSLGAPQTQVGLANSGNLGFTATVENAAPLSMALLIVSTTAAQSVGCGPHLDLTPGALLNPILPSTCITVDAAGVGVLSLPLPAGPFLSGITLRTQWAVFDPSGAYNPAGIGFALSAARTIRIF